MKAILFDLDGVLMPGPVVHLQVIRVVLQEMGSVASPGLHHCGLPTIDVFRDLAPEWDAHKLAEAVRRKQLWAVDFDGGAPMTGAVSLVEWAASLVPVAIVTGASRRRATSVVDKYFGGSISVVVTGDDASKLATAPWELAAEKLGVPITGCVVVEDGTAGCLSARAAKCQYVVGVACTVTGADLLRAGADIVFENLSGVHLWLRAKI